MVDPGEPSVSRSKGALILMPTPAVQTAGPVAVWITAAGWVEAASKRFGSAWLVTPEGVLTPCEARDLATRPSSLRSRPHPWGRFVPSVLRTARKDIRDLRRARRFMQAGLKGPWEDFELAFVMQHHELFHSAGELAARRFGCPLVAFVDAAIVWEGEKWGVRRPGWGRVLEWYGETRRLKAADLVACVSEQVAEQVTRMGVDKSRVVVTPCAVNVASFKPQRSATEVRKQLGVDSSAFVVGWVGSFRRFHGLELLLRAFDEFQRNERAAVLVLVGDGLDRPRVEQLAKEAEMDNVRFVGQVPHQDVASYLGAFDVAVVIDPGTGAFHYSPLKVREYMAAGRAIVAPCVGQLTNFLRDGENCILTSPGDATAIASALRRVHDDPALRDRLGAAAQHLIQEVGSWDEQLEKVVESLSARIYAC